MRRLAAPSASCIALLGLAAAACIERAPNAGGRREAVDRGVAAGWLVREARPAHRVDATLGGIELIGADVDPPGLRPGGRVRITFYWRVLEEPETSWSVFVHLDASGAARLNGDHAPAGGAYPTNAWRRGEVIRDPVVIQLPAAYPAASVDLWAGLYSGTERCPVTRPGPLGQDGADRILVARLPVQER